MGRSMRRYKIYFRLVSVQNIYPRSSKLRSITELRIPMKDAQPFLFNVRDAGRRETEQTVRVQWATLKIEHRFHQMEKLVTIWLLLSVKENLHTWIRNQVKYNPLLQRNLNAGYPLNDSISHLKNKCYN